MQLQPKAIDSSQNVIDIRKARNANELITVIGRINTALRQQQSQHRTERTKVKFGELSKQYDGLRWVLQTQAELLAAISSAQHLNDAKRERCVTALAHLNTDVLELKRSLITRINAASKRMVSDKLGAYANVVHDFLRPLCEKLYSISMYNDNVTCVAFIARNVQAQDGFTSPEVCIKLTERDGGIYVSMPYSPFVETDTLPVIASKDLDYFLKGALNYQRAPAPTPKEERLLRIEGITRVDVTDTLNLHMDSAVRPTDINGILRTVIPLIKRSFARDQFEVLHRFNNTGDTKCLQFCIAKRKVVDPRSLTKLTRMLGMSKSQITQMTELLETP